MVDQTIERKNGLLDDRRCGPPGRFCWSHGRSTRADLPTDLPSKEYKVLKVFHQKSEQKWVFSAGKMADREASRVDRVNRNLRHL